MSKKKRSVLDPNIDKKLLSDIKYYENLVTQHKLKQMKNGLKGGELADKVKECIDDTLDVIRANLVENGVNEVNTRVCMGIYEKIITAVMNDNTLTPLVPPTPIVIDNDEKDAGVKEGVKGYGYWWGVGLAAGAIGLGVFVGGKKIMGDSPPKKVNHDDDFDW